MTRLKEPTDLELEPRTQDAASEPSPDDADAPDTGSTDLENDETQPPSSGPEHDHEDIWSAPDI